MDVINNEMEFWLSFILKRSARILAVIATLYSSSLFAQDPNKISQFTETVPGDLLATKCIVLHDYTFKQKELEEIQKAFQKIGIDAVAYFETDVVTAGKDVVRAYAEYFNTRQVKYMLWFEKSASGYQIIGTLFDLKPTLFDVAQPAWKLKKEKLSTLLLTVYQDAWRGQKKKNYLVNEYPETDIAVSPIRGNRQEFYAIDLKVDNLAVPKFGDAAMDQELADFFQANYPMKYKITEAGVEEPELRRQGFSYVLCYVHTRGKAAKEVLGYDVSKRESTYASITFPTGQLQLATIPVETVVYKFYFRHIDNGNVFLGTKWDADIQWKDALRNHVLAFKTEAKIN